MKSALLVGIALASFSRSLAAAPPPDPLAGIDRLAERALAEWKNPGVAVAVVRGGKSVYAKGFGVREAGRPEKVDADTVFPIASLTKGFTAALAGMMAAEGKLDLDEPLVRRLPELVLADAAVNRELTIRDALAHRSGLAGSGDLLWAVGGFDRTEILRRLRFVPQESPIRTRESYQNVLVTAVGEALGRQAGTSWEALVASRLLEPLGLSRTFVSPALARSGAGGNLASPSIEEEGIRRPASPDDPAPVAPAAAILSTARDLARWIALFLGRGELEGKRLLAAETVDALLAPQMLQEIGPSYRKLMPETHLVAWGLGWVVQDYRGRLLAWNTGGLAGCSGTIAFLPEEGIGVVVLSNDGRTGFPEGIAWSLLDRLTGAPEKDWVGLRLERSRGAAARAAALRAEAEKTRIAGTHPTLPTADYAGVWSQDLLGTATVTAEPTGNGLSLRIGRDAAARMVHWHRDTWLATWEPAGWGRNFVHFQLGVDGRPERMVVEEIGEFRRAAGREPGR